MKREPVVIAWTLGVAMVTGFLAAITSIDPLSNLFIWLSGLVAGWAIFYTRRSPTKAMALDTRREQ